MKKPTIGRKTRRMLFAAVLAAVITAGAIYGAISLKDYIDGINEAGRLKNMSQTDFPEPTVSASGPENPDLTQAVPEEADEPGAPGIAMPKYEKLIKLNSEVSGWIKIDGTRIDYPVLWHKDNDYYLHMSIENKKSKRGCIYMDYRNSTDLSDKNTLIYGHNMKDGSMFKDLVQYKNRDFFNSHGIIHMDSLYEQIDWQVFSVYVVDADKETIDIDYRDDESFLRELNRYKSRSMYEADVDLDSGDSVITLVTCSYETNNSRTIVHAKRLKG